MLQIAIHGDDVFAARVIETGSQSCRLAKVAAQLDDCYPAVDRSNLTKQPKGRVGRAVVDQNNLKTLTIRLHHCFEAIVEIRNIFLLVMQGNHNRILWHGSFYYTGICPKAPVSSESRRSQDTRWVTSLPRTPDGTISRQTRNQGDLSFIQN